MASARKAPARAKPERAGKIAVVADAHVHNFTYQGGEWEGGLNQRGKLCLSVLAEALAQAEAVGCTHFFVAGDLFHVQRPEPALIAAVQRVFAKSKVGIVVVPGNHDMLGASAKDGNTACAPLWQEATIVNEPTLFEVGHMEVLAVPFNATLPMREYLAEVLLAKQGSWSEGKQRVLVTHVGVYGDDPPPWAVGARDAISSARMLDLMNSFEVGTAFVGNYHDAGIWQDELTAAAICQVGTLCPHGFGDAGFHERGHVATFGGPGSAGSFSVPGPRFLTIREGHPVPEVPRGCRAFARVEREAKNEQAAAAFAGYEVEEADLAKPVEAPKLEALVDDPVEAIRQDVERRPLPAEVPRDEVLNAVLDCWRRAS